MVNIYRELVIPLLVESIVTTYLFLMLQNIWIQAEDNLVAKWCEHPYPKPVLKFYRNNF